MAHADLRAPPPVRSSAGVTGVQANVPARVAGALAVADLDQRRGNVGATVRPRGDVGGVNRMDQGQSGEQYAQHGRGRYPTVRPRVTCRRAACVSTRWPSARILARG